MIKFNKITGSSEMQLLSSYYEFFGIALVFQTNSRKSHAEFQDLYGYFQESFCNSDAPVVCSLVRDGRSSRYNVSIKSPRYSAHYTLSGKVSADTYMGMFNPVIYEVKDFFLIHAASLSTRDSRSLIISAPCSFGKTTLTRELLKKGFMFLSDELAPVNRLSGLIHPYPRGLGVISGKDKKIISGKNMQSSPCKPSFVVFLCLQQLEEETDTKYIELALARMDKNLYDELLRLPQVKEITALSGRLFPMLRLHIAKESYIMQEIQKICSRNRVPIMYALRGKTVEPDYTAKPELQQLSIKEGIFEVMRNVLNAHASALLEDVFGNSHSRMLFRLSKLMSQAEFYRLTVGKLSEMSELVKNLCSGNNL